jgi:hypothetical protein
MRDNTMSIQIEMHLREMGILPANIFDEMEQVSQSLQDHRMRMSKGFYDDPRGMEMERYHTKTSFTEQCGRLSPQTPLIP